MVQCSKFELESIAVRPLNDGWLGTHELPGYRAGNVVVKLEDLPEVDSDHLYFDLLLLDPSGHTEENHSGPCQALARHMPLLERSRFVRMVAELFRHVPNDGRGLTAISRALNYIRELGVELDRIIAAAQLLDDACNENVVVESLTHVLKLSLGESEAQHEMCEVVFGVARINCMDHLKAARGDPKRAAAELHAFASEINESGLAQQVAYVVRMVGKTRARRYLRKMTDFHMVPTPEMFGV